MRLRVVVAAALAVALGVMAASAGASSGHQQANKLTVWLQVDAQSGWPDVVAAANQAFQAQNPGWTVNVQYQNWGDHLQKFDATIAGNDTPDVIEMGNTEMTAYMASGAFADITASKSKFPNSDHWLAGLAKSGMSPGQALRRALLRRLARRHLSDRPLQEGGHREAADQPHAVHVGPEEGRGDGEGREGLLGHVHGRHRLVQRDRLGLRLRRNDRDHARPQVGWRAQLEAVDRRAHRVQELLHRGGSQVEQQRSTKPIRPRTPCSRKAWRARYSARRGSAAAPARSTRPSRLSS